VAAGVAGCDAGANGVRLSSVRREATGATLSDDATVLCLDWHGGHGQDRHSVHGAEPGRASQPFA
jgi:hypothetical protein